MVHRRCEALASSKREVGMGRRSLPAGLEEVEARQQRVDTVAIRGRAGSMASAAAAYGAQASSALAYERRCFDSGGGVLLPSSTSASSRAQVRQRRLLLLLLHPSSSSSLALCSQLDDGGTRENPKGL
jgi:hypothetical protein